MVSGLSPGQRWGVADQRAAVPFLDLTAESVSLEAELVEAFRAVLHSGRFLWGEATEALEEDLARRFQVVRALATGSGTQALEILLLAHGIGPGQEIITSPASFFATAKAVAAVGARAVFADVDPDGYNLDPASVEARIGPRTRAILAVHLYGRPAPLRVLREICDHHRLLLLEDAAQAFGAALDGRPAGAWGHGAILSFYPTKNLGALGDAGAVLCLDSDLAARAASLRFFGWTGQRDLFGERGIKGGPDEVQAAFLRVKLRHVDGWLARRRELADRYDRELPPQAVRPPAAPGVEDARHLYVVRSPHRNRLASFLRERGIGSEVHYRVPLHQQPLFAPTSGCLPIAERWAKEVLSLPLHPFLRDEEQAQVITAVREALDA
jgi:dTDP-4-amino-4,6-dideoxygalactose transaminase